jgi:glycosyltransferase involved in cell wall biosynthesis
MLRQVASSDARLKLMHHSMNRGPSAARNTGFSHAQCEYVMMLDSDDLIEPTTIEKLYIFLVLHINCSFISTYSLGFAGQTYLWSKGFHSGSIFLYENSVSTNSMVKRSVWSAVGGFDEDIKTGLEDWDFWLKCADKGFWGTTFKEYLEWYRRRASHTDRWQNFDGAAKQQAFAKQLRDKYPRLKHETFPNYQSSDLKSVSRLQTNTLGNNALRKDTKSIVFILPWLTMGGADKFNLDIIGALTQQHWKVTIVTTLLGDSSWEHQFARYTPDIFILNHFQSLSDYPRLLIYLLESRSPDFVCVSNSELGYHLLPFIRANFPNITLVDYCHMEQEEWKSGGYPNLAVQHQSMLDINIVSSLHLKEWQTQRGAAPERIKVCYTNIDSNLWHRDEVERVIFRKKHEIDAEELVILYAGRLVQQKQPAVFIKTIHTLARKNLKFVAVIAGNGAYLAFLKQYVNQYKLAKYVHFVGALSSMEMKNALSASDIFFLPSQWEGISLAIYEAMSMGLAIVGADVGGQRELVTPDCGYLIKRSDEETESQQYVDVLSELLESPTKVRQFGDAARHRVVHHFPLDAMVEGFKEALQLAQSNHIASSKLPVDINIGWSTAMLAIEYQRVSDVAETLWAQRELGAGQFSITYYIYRLLQRRFGWLYLQMVQTKFGRPIKTILTKFKKRFK